MSNKLTNLRERLARITDLKHAAAVLEWDQETCMPEGGAMNRAKQIATLRGFAHELFVADETIQLVGEAASELGLDLENETGFDYLDSGESSNDETDSDFSEFAADLLRVCRKDLIRARRVPSDLVAELAETSSIAKGAWQKARENDDFTVFSPHLSKIIDLNVRHAEALGYDDSPYDALLDQYERGMTTAEVSRVFNRLREGLVPLVEAVADGPRIPDNVLRSRYPFQEQWDFGLEVAQDIGYDLSHGRQDLSAHPFSTSFSSSDVRITTRIDENFFNPGFFGTLHEAGHAMYEQGVDPLLARTPLGEGTSLGMHESQSRLWENLVARSKAFWSHYFTRAREHFPEALAKVEEEAFYRAVNSVRPSPIRVEADELTYNLHIMLRFDLEQDMISGSIETNDLPQAWNDRMEAYLGIRPKTNRTGVLQDIHWSLGALGYFPTYALGNLMSVQLYNAAEEDIDGLRAQIARGEFDDLRNWLRVHVHRWGRSRSASSILEGATGSTLTADPWLRYAENKVAELYR